MACWILIFVVNVEIPRGLNEKQKSAMKAFAESCGECNYTKHKQFFKKVNPRRISEPATMPRLRCLRDCVTQFNKDYPNRKIDKATVSRYMKSKLVTRYFHGNTWFINYDELEKVLLKKVRINSKLKTK
mgnify:CR=1 FL=1